MEKSSALAHCCKEDDPTFDPWSCASMCGVCSCTLQHAFYFDILLSKVVCVCVCVCACVCVWWCGVVCVGVWCFVLYKVRLCLYLKCCVCGCVYLWVCTPVILGWACVCVCVCVCV